MWVSDVVSRFPKDLLQPAPGLEDPKFNLEDSKNSAKRLIDWIEATGRKPDEIRDLAGFLLRFVGEGLLRCEVDSVWMKSLPTFGQRLARGARGLGNLTVVSFQIQELATILDQSRTDLKAIGSQMASYGTTFLQTPKSIPMSAAIRLMAQRLGLTPAKDGRQQALAHFLDRQKSSYGIFGLSYLEGDEMGRLLREFVTSEAIGSFRENAVAILRPSLPVEPISVLWLQQVVAPLTPFARTRLWLALAYCGRDEVKPLVRVDVAGGDAEDRLRAATALAILDERAGLRAVEALYRQVRQQSDGSVPLDWITEDCLLRDLGTPGALSLRARLRADAGWDGVD